MQSKVTDVPLSLKVMYNVQLTVIGIPLSSKEMCTITENDVWKRLGFSR